MIKTGVDPFVRVIKYASGADIETQVLSIKKALPHLEKAIIVPFHWSRGIIKEISSVDRTNILSGKLLTYFNVGSHRLDRRLMCLALWKCGKIIFLSNLYQALYLLMIYCYISSLQVSCILNPSP